MPFIVEVIQVLDYEAQYKEMTTTKVEELSATKRNLHWKHFDISKGVDGAIVIGQARDDSDNGGDIIDIPAKDVEAFIAAIVAVNIKVPAE